MLHVGCASHVLQVKRRLLRIPQAVVASHSSHGNVICLAARLCVPRDEVMTCCAHSPVSPLLVRRMVAWAASAGFND
jgi:hypothetical protein